MINKLSEVIVKKFKINENIAYLRRKKAFLKRYLLMR